MNKPKVYLIDVDENLTTETCWNELDCLMATPDREMIDWVNKQYENHFIVIHTARRNNLYMATMEWLRANNVKYHAVSFEKTPGVTVDRNAINTIDKLQ